jgi:alpha-ketoglutaric semialdehyde dehydrogenase
MPESTQGAGRHLIDGEWVEGSEHFHSDPANGMARRYSRATAADVDRAANAAERAFLEFGWSTRQERVNLLDAIAAEIERRGSALTEIGSAETGLPAGRLEGERGRTTGQLRLFARHISEGAYLDRRHEPADPRREPLPRPELRLVQRPLGPVGVFGASNFPLAFSTVGGDTASALAAGCPVIVKGHPGHPGTSELVAEAILAAIRSTGVHPGIFALLQSDTNEAGEALVTHPLVKAIGFTGSLRGGRALFDLAARRPEPIPFFGELGSVNPVFVLPHAAERRGDGIARGWVVSMTMGVGQFCTNPGVVVLPEGAAADRFEAEAAAALSQVKSQPMLSTGIAAAFMRGSGRLAGGNAVRTILAATVEERGATPGLYATDAETFLSNPELGEEVFGPAGILVRAADGTAMMAVAHAMHGQLTATLQMEDDDLELARRLVPILERKAGRILANGFPTGVEVSDAMMHGGPYPASTNAGSTSVGTLAIRRFLRPVAYQDMPEALLPADLLA